jgi:hypothetical protein
MEEANTAVGLVCGPTRRNPNIDILVNIVADSFSSKILKAKVFAARNVKNNHLAL